MISMLPTICLIGSGVILSILTGIMNRLRGGALNDCLTRRKAGVRVSHTITRALVTILTLTAFYLPLKYNTGIDLLTWPSLIYTLCAFLSFFIFGLCSGWGSYFDLGLNKRGYVNHREVLWIDYILFKLFGQIWIPKRGSFHKTQFEMDNDLRIEGEKFDIVVSPTGEERPKSWREKRDFIGMCLRGLQFYVPLCIIIYYQMKLCYNIEYPSLFYIIPFGLLFGPIYKMSQSLTFIKGKYIDHYTSKAEVITGSMLFVYVPYFILLYNY